MWPRSLPVFYTAVIGLPLGDDSKGWAQWCFIIGWRPCLWANKCVSKTGVAARFTNAWSGRQGGVEGWNTPGLKAHFHIRQDLRRKRSFPQYRWAEMAMTPALFSWMLCIRISKMVEFEMNTFSLVYCSWWDNWGHV